MQKTRFADKEYGAGSDLIEVQCLGRCCSKRSKHRLLVSRNELCISKALVVAIISEELGGVAEKVIQVNIRNAGRGLQALPVPT
ncbi:hypothetical protein RRF57_010156 [Xylaria bambusicola]|uniref:Uncharacterized protein n=1 Tax=Xylaria bambusicola TaxID=326684 RepID=A0AAN7V3D0_9PEZI